MSLKGHVFKCILDYRIFKPTLQYMYINKNVINQIYWPLQAKVQLLFYGNLCLGPLWAWINYDTDEVPLLNIYSQVTNQNLSNNFELLFNSRVLLKLVHFPQKNHSLLLNDLYLICVLINNRHFAVIDNGRCQSLMQV
jgi:hypothetical protein